MKLSIDNSRFAIYDEVFNAQEFDLLWNWVRKEQYTSVQSSHWQKVWRIGDGNPVNSVAYLHSQSPFNNALDLIHHVVTKIASFHPNICGKWTEISFRSYIYPRGTKIDWHTDEGYAAAAIFYTHPKWMAHWGGELKIAETPKNYKYEDAGSLGDQLDVSWREDVLNTWAVGQYIAPKPNRLVLTTGGIWHCINRVDQDAGDNARCSIVCFFKDMDKK